MKNYKNNTLFSISQKGFSLLELMIAVGILGIITSIAYPSYVKQVQKSKRTAAKVELMRIAQLQESFYVQNLSYASALSGAANAGGLGFPTGATTSEGGEYAITVNAFNAAGNACAWVLGGAQAPCISYFLTAVPVSGKSQDHDSHCTGFRLTSTGIKLAKNSSIAFNSTDNNAKVKLRDECW